MNTGYFRVATSSPSLSIADPTFNSEKIISLARQASSKGVGLFVLPELCITGYSCADLFFQSCLQEKVYENLKHIAHKTKNLSLLLLVGLPVTIGDFRYNCASFIFRGKVLALVPKTFIPNSGEFYERRWFTPFMGKGVRNVNLTEGLEEIPFGTDIIVKDPSEPLVRISAELCEDLWAPISPSSHHALNGATIIANLSASNEVALKDEYRRLLVSAHSAKNIIAYIYSNAGHDESTTDMVFSGHSLIALNGKLLSEKLPFELKENLLISDLDLEKIEQERLKSTTFAQAASRKQREYKTISAEGISKNADFRTSFFDTIEVNPFVPGDSAKRKERCLSVINMQAEGLSKRMRHTKAKTAVIGLSGGLDSTLSLLVTSRAFDLIGKKREDILSVTLPAFGTTERTLSNAKRLASSLGTTLKEIDIKEAVNVNFKNIEHDPAVHDVTYENSQARERTKILMNLANKNGGLVIGTGDLSELALGWCTYSGDQISMYGVNSSIPKTLVRHLVSHFADEAEEKGDTLLSETLRDILLTPVSPELLPPEDGKISQKTEEIVGPYELHDFFLYYVLRWGFSPEKILFLAEKAFCCKKDTNENSPSYSKDEISKWLNIFYRRFFSQQFKRSCMPDGAKVGTVSLSPRGDWRMPSDSSPTSWLKDI